MIKELTKPAIGLILMVPIIAIFYLFIPKSVSIQSYNSLIKDKKNGLRAIKKQGALKYDLQYRPNTLVALQELGPDNISQKAVNKILKELGKTQYYNLKISVDAPSTTIINYGCTNQSDIDTRVAYLSFDFQNDIRLIQGKDTLQPLLYHFERSYDLSPYRTFVLAFADNDLKSNNPKKDRKLLINSSYLKTGVVEMPIHASSLNRIPKVSL